MKLKDYPHMSSPELNRLKGTLRRYFSRGNDLKKGQPPTLHQIAQARTRVTHCDPKRPRCEKWSWCEGCGEVIPTWTTAIDHIDPVVPIDTHFEDMTITEAFERLRCSLDNLQTLCTPCHDRKTKAEKEARKPFAKPRTKKSKKACT